jgi:hypothetical protein
MEKAVGLIPETRKKWIAPQLKKVDVEALTASGFSTSSSDATHFS